MRLSKEYEGRKQKERARKWEQTHLEGEGEILPKFLTHLKLGRKLMELRGFEGRLGVNKRFGVDVKVYL